MLNDFETKFNQFEKDIVNEQRRIPSNSTLSIYYGITSEKCLRLSFVSSIPPVEIESTKEIKVTQGKESENIYWTCFDLLNDDAKDVFYIFCESLVDSIIDCKDDFEALNAIKERYCSWKYLLKNKGKMSLELYQGLFGELYFLSEYLIKKVGINDAVKAWVGPNGFSKDFSLSSTWYEIKTIGSSSSTIKINSLAQLDSNTDGHLVAIVVERMSDCFENKLSSIHELYETILKQIDDQTIKANFKNKVLKYGYVDEEYKIYDYKFETKHVKSYCVNNSFPRLTREKLNTHEIKDVTYELSINAIEKYKEEI